MAFLGFAIGATVRGASKKRCGRHVCSMVFMLDSFGRILWCFMFLIIWDRCLFVISGNGTMIPSQHFGAEDGIGPLKLKLFDQ